MQLQYPPTEARLPSAALAACLLFSACSIRDMAVESLADSLAAGGDVYSSDDDPELIRDALPFALKTMESLHAEVPRHRGLLTALSRSFTQYAYAFVETDALLLEEEDYDAALALRERALKLYLRARDYGLRGLELDYPGIMADLPIRPEQAVARLEPETVELAFWTGASWGAAIALGLDRAELVADVDAARSLLARVLELEPDFDRGAAHEAMIAVESLPEIMGGSPERAREHFEAAVALAEGQSAGAFVSMAVSGSLPAQDRSEFEALLARALAVDPDHEPARRLANLIAQRRARHLATLGDVLFLETLE